MSDGDCQLKRIAELETQLRALQEERDALARALKEAEVYRLAVTHAPMGVMCTSQLTGRYVFSNPAHAAFFGCTPEQVVSGDPFQRWKEMTHPDDFDRELRELQRLAAGEITSYESERRCVRANGEIRWTRSAVVGVRNQEGRLAYIYVYLMDMHEQRLAVEERERLEVQLHQSQKLEALGRLAGGVAHDFNNRLVIIMGYAEVLRNSLPPGSAGVDQANMVLSSSQRAAELTRQLLAYSRRQALKPQAFLLNEAVDRMRVLLERLIGDDIELVTTLRARNPVFSDPGQIEQVILNLAFNARDAMPNGGRLTLETRDVAVGPGAELGLAAGTYVALIVRDTGTGIPQEIVPRIFEPFFTTKEVGKGTGLGLATVEGIVRQSGGAVQVETSEPGGTTFSVFLPRARAIERRASATRVETPHQLPHFECLLVCDDDDEVRELLVSVLRIRAYQVLEARNGKHALEVAANHGGPIDLLITDLVMPELSGTQLAAELRKSRPTLKVLFISGYTQDDSVLSGTLDPGSQFLAKPFLPGELARAVHGMLAMGDATASPSQA
jgi:two-component system, cell cycle sensor histidine kinase and response regulator CckA